jgi:pimeloyl-ACP methyl ester carboxylesterase
MPTLSRPDGATIHYEVQGSGFPLLLIAPGGVSSQISFWERNAFNPMTELSDEFMVIGMDQRHAGESFAPAKAFDWADGAADQVAVLDAVGAKRAHVMGGCIGCAYIWNLIQAAPERVAAAVPQNPVGLDESNNLGTFYAMFNETMRVARSEGPKAVVEAAKKNSLFVMNNAAGPFSARLGADEAFQAEIAKMPVETYVALIVRFRDGMWPDKPPYFTATPEWMRSCQVPMLVAPGNDPFHPRGIGERICREAPKATCLPFEWGDPANRDRYITAVREFLRANTPN